MFQPQMPEEVEKLEYIYQHFQEHGKVYESNPWLTTEVIQDTLYLPMNNDIEYELFENVIDSYYLDSQIRDGFQCTKLVTHLIPQQVQGTQTHHVHMHMTIFHNNFIP